MTPDLLPYRSDVAQYQAQARRGGPVHVRPRAVDIDDLQRQIDGFLARHPIPEDRDKTRRIDAILLRRRIGGGT